MFASIKKLQSFDHVADAVSYLNQLKTAEALKLAAQLDAETLINLLESPELKHSHEITLLLISSGRADVLDCLAEDRMADLMTGFNPHVQQQGLALLSPSSKASILRLMSYPQGTAGSIMTTEFIQAPMTWTVAQTLQHIREVESTRETVYAIYVVDIYNRLQFVLPLRQLVIADAEQPLTELWTGQTPVMVDPYTDREEVARLIRLYNFLALPVVDDDEHVVGIVTVDDVIDALMDEAAEDLGRFGGGEHIGKPYLDVGFGTMVRKRGGWLAILFLGEMLTASAMQFYEMELEKAVVLAMFIPLIMSSGGNSGSQATSLLIRGLALGEVKLKDWWRVILREFPTGFVLGAGLGAIGFLRIFAWQHLGIYDYGEHYILLGFTIWASLIGIVCFGSSLGSMLPFLLQRFNFDPASASAPLVATLVDVLGLVIYFSVAALILTGTIL
ncbi:MAG TPA: magnesium transporter [Paenalcaligenes hominis]|uniref:Magnesium transporter MgtE n=1 Tax=Paenalcaligenes hominis TaxID=643674 RepID=A0A9D2VEY4_9BURK|nr:magnesium transporter [Paenalcaligenes hominis]